MGSIRIGTSGYVYSDWRGLFYPPQLPSSRWLPHYAQHFSTVELNATFYRLPTADAVDRWRDQTPPEFLFACKGSRFLTHMKRLLDTGRGLDRFFAPVLRLGPKLGPVLWQLTPQMKRVDIERLENFLHHLPTGIRYAFEFRDAAWYTTEVCDLLDTYGAAFCEHDLVDAVPPRATGGFRYLRFHGKTGKYRGRYGRAALRKVARDLAAWSDPSTRSGKTGRSNKAQSRDVFVYFNNDSEGHAISDALDLLALLG